MLSQIVVAGASGFVGRALISRLRAEFPHATITALSRSPRASMDSHLVWKQCDLFCEDSIARALPDHIDLAYYLVHSMEPTAGLDQGSFADYDLIMADNFARVCRAKRVTQLVYLGGLIPQGSKLSLHLQSRLEVENVFREHQIPFTFFRAGLILGEGGSSFQILLKLVKRLHVMICPAWTQTQTSPVDLATVVSALVSASKTREHLYQTYDLAGCRPLTYLEMMKWTGQQMGLKRFFIKVPLFSPTLSRLWVCLVTQTPRNLVYPLIESLRHPMVARDSHTFSRDYLSRSYPDLLKGVSMKIVAKPSRLRVREARQTVRSVQRLPAQGQAARGIAEAYFRWLPQMTRGLIFVERQDQRIRLRLMNRITLIELEEVPETPELNRLSFAIKGGALVHPNPAARLEFRLVLSGENVLIAVHDYAPSLPWFIYRYTQALAHLWVMRGLKSFLSRPKFLGR